MSKIDGVLSSRPARSLGTQAVALSAGTAMAQIIVAVMYLITARHAGPEDYGRLVAAIALGGSALGFFDFGTNAYWIRERASGRLTLEALSSRLSSKLLIACSAASLSIFVSIVWFPQYLPASAIFLAGTFAQALMVPLRAARRGEVVAVLSIIERAIALCLFLLALLAGVDPLSALWASLVLGTCAMGTTAYLLSKSAGRPRLAWKAPVNPWVGSKFYGLSSLATSGQQLDLPVLTAVAGPVAAGIYGGVNRWTQPMGLLASAFSSASAPFIAHATDWRTTRKLVFRASWLLALAVAVCIALIFLAPTAVELLLGAEFGSSAPVLQWLAMGTIPAIVNQPLAAALQARKYDHFVAAVYLSSVLIQLGLVIALGSTLGAMGAAIAFCALQILLMCSLLTCISIAVRKDRVANHAGGESIG